MSGTEYNVVNIVLGHAQIYQLTREALHTLRTNTIIRNCMSHIDIVNQHKLQPYHVSVESP